MLFKKQIATAAFDGKRAEKDLLEKNWTGNYPYLRLIHCLIDNDDIKRAFLYRNDVDSTRMTEENRNSVDKCQKTVWELLSDKWNLKKLGKGTYQNGVPNERPGRQSLQVRQNTRESRMHGWDQCDQLLAQVKIPTHNQYRKYGGLLTTK